MCTVFMYIGYMSICTLHTYNILFFPQGNIWEDMKDDSFSLDTLAAFSNSPLQLSDCDLGTIGLTPVSSSSDHSFTDFQVTSLYTTYANLDNSTPSQCVTGPGNKPIALL